MEQRESIPVVNPDPELGLTEEQVRQRIQAGWVSGTPRHSGKTEREIILTHCFTFFNLIFVVLGALLLLAGSSVMNLSLIHI